MEGMWYTSTTTVPPSHKYPVTESIHLTRNWSGPHKSDSNSCWGCRIPTSATPHQKALWLWAWNFYIPKKKTMKLWQKVKRNEHASKKQNTRSGSDFPKSSKVVCCFFWLSKLPRVFLVAPGIWSLEISSKPKSTPKRPPSSCRSVPRYLLRRTKYFP